MDPDLELFKDYFESINAEDTYPVPGCEENDPLGFSSSNVPLGDLVSDQDLLTPLSFLQENVSLDYEAENIETQIKQEDPIQSSSGTSFGSLKIADFAVDPDLCSILQPSPFPSTLPSPSVSSQIPVFQLPSHASFIRFSRAENQLRKVYNFSSFDVQIVTSSAEENSFGQDLKLFISAKEQITKIEDLEVSLTPISGSEYLLHSQQFWLYSDIFKWTKQKTITILDENGTENYFSGIAPAPLCLVKKDLYGRFDVQRKISQKNIVKYYYFKEDPTIRFLKEMKTLGLDIEKLGHEGTPDHPKDPVRKTNVKRLLNGLGHYYRKTISVVPNLEVAAILMEEDMYEQLNFSNEDVSKNVPHALENFHSLANGKPDYRHLMMRPDIFYLALTRPLIRVTTQTSSQAPVRLTQSNMTPNVIRSFRPQRAPVVSASTVIRPVIRLQGQRQQTVRMLRPVNPPSFHVRQGLTSTPNTQYPQLRQALTNIVQPGTPQTRLLLRTSTPVQPQTSQPIILSVSSLASPASAAPNEHFVCPGYPNKCKDGGFKSRSNMIDHWTMGHFFDIINRTVSAKQKNLGCDFLNCPSLHCGFSAANRVELIKHYGAQHNVAVQQLQRDHHNLQNLVNKGFQFITRETDKKTVCSLCGLTMFSEHLSHHQAIQHFFQEYIERISSVPGYNSSLIKQGVCPICPDWKAISDHVTGDSFLKSNKILLVKHYSDSHCPVKLFLSSTTSTSAAKVSPAASSGPPPPPPPPPPISEQKQKDEQSLFCKLCKRLVASKRLNDGKIRTFNLVGRAGGRSKCECKSKKTVICRFCGTTVDCLTQDLEKHLDSEEHKQKEKVFHLLNDVYYRARGIDENSPYDATNYKFFILALKAFAVNNEGISVMNCLSLLQNILDMSLTQYNELYRHVDRLAGELSPNFLCYPCNFAAYGPISALSRHSLTQSHKEAVASLASEFLSCTQCAALFSTENIMSHAQHLSEKSHRNPELDLQQEKAKGKKRKVESSVRTEEEEEKEANDNFIDDILKSSDDEIDDQQHADLESNKKESDGSGRDEENNESFHSEDYYYFCLDCEHKLPDQDVNCTLLNQTRCPISMDIAKHIESRGHTNFVPISGGCTVKIRNLSFSADHHKIVVKKWKRLIRDGDITEVNYDIPRTCGKCKAVIPDAIEMFKHIRQRHHHQHDDR